MTAATAARPAAPAALRRDAARHLALAALVLVLAASLAAAVTPVDAAYPLRALALFAPAAWWLWRALPAHSPHRRFGPANRVTLARLVLVLLLAAAVGTPAPAWGLVAVAAAAALLDAADGAVARANGVASAYGARFDMETDALLIAVLALLLWSSRLVPAWVLAAGAMRYAFVAAALVWRWLARPLPPNRRRQAACVVAVVLLIVALAPVVAVPAAAAAVALVALAASFAVDVAWLARRRHAPWPQKEAMP